MGNKITKDLKGRPSIEYIEAKIINISSYRTDLFKINENYQIYLDTQYEKLSEEEEDKIFKESLRSNIEDYPIVDDKIADDNIADDNNNTSIFSKYKNYNTSKFKKFKNILDKILEDHKIVQIMTIPKNSVKLYKAYQHDSGCNQYFDKGEDARYSCKNKNNLYLSFFPYREYGNKVCILNIIKDTHLLYFKPEFIPLFIVYAWISGNYLKYEIDIYNSLATYYARGYRHKINEAIDKGYINNEYKELLKKYVNTVNSPYEFYPSMGYCYTLVMLSIVYNQILHKEFNIPTELFLWSYEFYKSQYQEELYDKFSSLKRVEFLFKAMEDSNNEQPITKLFSINEQEKSQLLDKFADKKQKTMFLNLLDDFYYYNEPVRIPSELNNDNERWNFFKNDIIKHIEGCNGIFVPKTKLPLGLSEFHEEIILFPPCDTVNLKRGTEISNGGDTSKKRVTYMSKKYIARKDTEGRNYIMANKSKVLLADIRGKYRYIIT